MWIEPVEFMNENNGVVVLSCPNPFSKKRVLEYYNDLIVSEMQKISSKPCRIALEVSEKRPAC